MTHGFFGEALVDVSAILGVLSVVGPGHCGFLVKELDLRYLLS